MTGQTLLIAIARTSRAIKHLRLDGSIESIKPHEAAALVRDRTDYRGIGSKHRVRAIQQFKPKRLEPWTRPACLCGNCTHCRRAAVPVSIDWTRAMGYA